MASNFDKYQKRRLRSSYFSVVVSIALVLFLTGLLGLVLLKYNSVTGYFKEKIAVSLYLKDKVTNEQIFTFKESLKKEPFAKKVIYINKDKAAKTYSADIGEDFLEFLGTNPLKNGIDIYLKADFVTPEQLEKLEDRFSKNAFVAEVSYDKPLINLLTRNSKRIGFWLLVLSGFFGLIAIILINSSIRLSIYSKRFTIKTMQMVGATKGFIRKPFIWRSITLGLVGALIALIGLAFAVYYIDGFIPTLQLLTDYKTLGTIAAGVVLFSILITGFSTFLAAQRFLNLKTDELYY